ncbi:MAG: type II secretion system protein N [Xanthomonadales bacterium]|nr:type II secretion system protein N [Xanthomonadales bacterium]
MRKLLSRLVITLLLLLALLIGLAWFTPASLLGNLLEKQGSSLQLGLLKGRLHDGSAGQARWQGIDIGKLSWQIGGFSIAPAATDVSFQASGPQMQAQGSFNAQRELVSSNDLNGHFPASWLNLQGLAPLLFAHGKISFDFSQLEVSKQGSPAANGVMDWQDAGLNGLLELSLGDIRFDISTLNPVTGKPSAESDSSREIVITFSNRGDTDLQLNGTITTDGRQYQLDCVARASPGRSDINRFLRKAGEVAADGSYRLQFEGLLSPGD